MTSDANGNAWRSLAGHRVLLLTVFLGVVVYAVGVVSLGPLELDEIAKDIGLALTVAGLLGLLVDRVLHRALVRQIDRAIASLRQGSDVFRGATNSNIEDIFARRGLPDDRARWQTKVLSAMRAQMTKGSGEVLVACVAAPQFFRSDTDVGAFLLNEMPRSACKLRVLLMCPDSRAADERASLEHPHPTKDDIRNAATFLGELAGRVGGGLVSVRCYENPATAFLIVTDTTVLLEPYPLTQMKQRGVPLGGRTPMLMLGTDAEGYDLWRGHFEYLWARSNVYSSHHP